MPIISKYSQSNRSFTSSIYEVSPDNASVVVYNYAPSLNPKTAIQNAADGLFGKLRPLTDEEVLREKEMIESISVPTGASFFAYVK
jgi:hypothetical protein